MSQHEEFRGTYIRVRNTDLLYSTSCMESFPCKHTVIIDGNERTWSAITVCKYLTEKGVKIPEHFEYAKNM